MEVASPLERVCATSLMIFAKYGLTALCILYLQRLIINWNILMPNAPIKIRFSFSISHLFFRPNLKQHTQYNIQLVKSVGNLDLFIHFNITKDERALEETNQIDSALTMISLPSLSSLLNFLSSNLPFFESHGFD
jgi:hypothetical protein